MKRGACISTCFWLLGCLPLLAQNQQYVEREIFIPWTEAQPNGLDALLVYYNSPGKHPLAVLTHGTGVGEDNAEVTPWQQLPQAIWFARRGWIALSVVRRGYGNSSGEIDNAQGGSRVWPEYRLAGLASAADLRRVIEYMCTFPQVDGAHVIAAGVSTGGFATVALTSIAPPGLVAAINFSGGRGPRHDSTARAYGNFGRSSRVPMLWLYARNDSVFGPELAQRFEAAFRSAGGRDQFILLPPLPNTGHSLYGNIPVWSGLVDNFLKANHLVFLPEPLPEPEAPDVPPPPGLSAENLKSFRNYLLLGPHKAFAISQNFVGSSWGNMTPDLACSKALASCNLASNGSETGSVVFVDNTAVSPQK